MNQSDSQKIEQKRCTCQADLIFSLQNSHYKRFKFDLAFNKSVRLQFQEEVKDNILESLISNSSIEEALIYHMTGRAKFFVKFWRKN